MKNIPHMKKKMSILTIGLVISLGVCAAGINYNGTNLTLNNEFTRSRLQECDAGD